MDRETVVDIIAWTGVMVLFAVCAWMALALWG